MGELVTGFKSTSFVEADFDMVPIKSIILWSGNIASIPSGWQLCDGTNGTPDLSSRFVMGAAAGRPVGERGGTSNHSHVFTGDGHTHAPGSEVDVAGAGPRESWDADANSEQRAVVGTTDFSPTLPRYHVLAYIQRFS